MTKLKNKGYIYKVTNIITGQFYIGQRSSYTGSPEDDLGVHYFTSSRYVRPLFKNNTSEWEKEILYRDIQYAETLNDMEGYAIHKVIKDPLCENRYDPTTRAGFSTAGTHQSEETRAKHSAANRGKHFSDETRAKLSAAHRGKHFSAETLAKIGEAQRGKHYSLEARAKISAAIRGKHRAPVSEETRAKLSESLKGHPCSAEARAKISAANLGKHLSDETRAKLSESLKGRPCSAETRAKLSAAERGKCHLRKSSAKNNYNEVTNDELQKGYIARTESSGR
jgi:hypothetical protein